MLKPANRLKKVRDFNLLFKNGRFVAGSFFDAKYIDLSKNTKHFPKNESVESFIKQLKIGFSIGLKISKVAVKRNRLKRQAREVVRLLLKEDKIKNGYYILFIAKKGSLEKDHAQISQEIELLLNKMKVL